MRRALRNRRLGSLVLEERLSLKASWVSLAVTSTAIAAFGLVVVVAPASPQPEYRAIGVASVGMGLFGAILSATAYRRLDKRAWFSLWYLPVFWALHFLWNLPPGKDHVHQIAFFALSLVGLLLPAKRFFSR